MLFFPVYLWVFLFVCLFVVGFIYFLFTFYLYFILFYFILFYFISFYFISFHFFYFFVVVVVLLKCFRVLFVGWQCVSLFLFGFSLKTTKTNKQNHNGPSHHQTN